MTIEEIKSKKFESESQLHAYIIRMISFHFPRLRGKYFHVKNESWNRRLAIQEGKIWRVETDVEFESRKMREGNYDKAMGKLAGVPDISLRHHGIMYTMELKHETGTLSDAQETLIELWRQDEPFLPTQIVYTAWHAYCYCKWICGNGLRINIPHDLAPFKHNP